MTAAGVVTTIGGTAGVVGGADGIGSYANFDYPAGIAVDSDGILYVADSSNDRITKGTPSFNYLPPTITTPSPLPSGTAGMAYNQAFTATGGTTPYTWSISSGSLPSGLNLSSGGVMSGTASAASTANFTVQVTGNDGLSSREVFSLTISAPTTITTASPLPGGTVGTAYWANVDGERRHGSVHVVYLFRQPPLGLESEQWRTDQRHAERSDDRQFHRAGDRERRAVLHGAL